MKKNENMKKSQQVVEEIKKNGKKTDPQGSYTGRNQDGNYEKPIQDQDDL